ncbi:MAG: hypothetical protein ACLFV3_07625 [Phycisphaeraceae bacterium]
MLERVSSRPAQMAWMKKLRLERIEGDTAVVRPLPGQEDVAGFASGRLSQLTDALEPILGQRVRVTLETAPGGAAAQAEQSSDGRGPSSSVRREVLGLPLVKRAMEVFPQAMLVDAREEQQPSDTLPAPPEPEDEDEPDEDG